MCLVNTWEVEHARRIGAEVQRLRKASKQSAQWLSDKTEQLGLKMTRQAIADLENGRRRFVTTAELVILAVALDTPPVCLVYPGPYDNSIEIVPDRQGAEFDAAQWFSGIDLGVPIVPAQESKVELGATLIQPKGSKHGESCLFMKGFATQSSSLMMKIGSNNSGTTSK